MRGLTVGFDASKGVVLVAKTGCLLLHLNVITAAGACSSWVGVCFEQARHACRCPALQSQHVCLPTSPKTTVCGLPLSHPKATMGLVGMCYVLVVYACSGCCKRHVSDSHGSARFANRVVCEMLPRAHRQGAMRWVAMVGPCGCTSAHIAVAAAAAVRCAEHLGTRHSQMHAAMTRLLRPQC